MVPRQKSFVITATLLLCFSVILILTNNGCEMDSFMNPSVVGRWETTPITLPILDRLDVIEESDATTLPVTQVRKSDLIPDIQEYTLGVGDVVRVNVFELIQPGTPHLEERRVDELGNIRLPVIGKVKASGLSVSQLEQEIVDVLNRKGILRDATVSVLSLSQNQNAFSVYGQPITGGTAIGRYTIPEPDFRLLDALAMARGVPGRTKKLLIFRQTAVSPEIEGIVHDEQIISPDEPLTATPQDPTQLIEDLLEGIDQEPESEDETLNQPDQDRQPPMGIEDGLGESENATQWVYVDGQWVRAGGPESPGAAERDNIQDEEFEELSGLITQRIIEVPYDRLIAGDMRFNIVIRPGDIIRVPDSTAGFVFTMGSINRPGAYSVPGERDLTLKQLIASAGGLNQLAEPERVDLIRRIGDNQEVTVRLNVKAIFDGTEPDIFLKSNDLLNFGTSFVATPIAVFRNGLRTAYGFAFVLDRNFGPEVLVL